MAKWNRILFIYLIQCVVIVSFGESISEKIYDTFHINTTCFRRLNGTHQIGCQTEVNGNVGIVHYIDCKAEIDYVQKTGPHPPYVVLLESHLFTSSLLLQFKNVGRVSGVLVINSRNRTWTPIPSNGLSPDSTCPKVDYGFYKNLSEYNNCSAFNWNSVGDGMLYEDWPFPIAQLANETQIRKIINDCYIKFNKPENNRTRNWPLCAAELRHRQHAAKDSETCIRRSNLVLNLNPATLCDPLADFNIWGFIKPLNKSTPLPPKSLVIVSAKIDSTSMFFVNVPAADSVVTGLVTLLAAAQALGKIKQDFINSKKNIMFVLFNGETFDYIGSSKMVYDMHNGFFPQELDDSIINQMPLINTSHIDYFIELSQLAVRDINSSIWIHSDPVSTLKPEVKQKVDELIKVVNHFAKSFQLPLSVAPESMPLPPASFQRFLMQDSQIPGVVMTNHRKEYSNKYYNGHFDVAETISLDELLHTPESKLDDIKSKPILALTAAASTLATSLYSILNPDSNKTIETNSSIVVHLLYCFLIKSNCSLFQAISSGHLAYQLDDHGLIFDIGVSRYEDNRESKIIERLLAYFLGDQVPISRADDCHSDGIDEIHSYIWMPGPLSPGENRSGYCIKSTVNHSLALSPVFNNPSTPYDTTLNLPYSTWTESRWDSNLQLRIFLKPSKSRETVVLCVGMIIMLLALVIVYFINKKASKIFVNTPQSEY